MNIKKLFIILFSILLIGILIYIICNNISVEKAGDKDYLDYTPQEEISDKQLNQTSITLYFVDKDTNHLKSEGKLISSTELLKNPYKVIIQKLLEGPGDESLKSAFPENTRLIDSKIEGNCVILNFSDDILNFSDDSQKFQIINSILNSLAQLTEVNSIKILINNEGNENFDEEYAINSENT